MSITYRQSKIKPVVVEVAIRNAIARRLREHGVAEYEHVTEQVMIDLLGKRTVPCPEGVPNSLTLHDVKLSWPEGLDTRVPLPEERQTYNNLLRLCGTDLRVTEEDNLRVLRDHYLTFANRVREMRRAQAKVQSATSPAPKPSVMPKATASPKAAKSAKAAKARKVQPVVPTTTTLMTNLQELVQLLEELNSLAPTNA